MDPGDRVEIFFSCDPDMSCYYGLEIDPQGKVMDYKNAFYRQFDFSWTGEVSATGRRLPAAYRVEASFGLDYLRSLGVLKEDGSLLGGLYRADALCPDDIRWYSLVDPHTPEPDFHVPGSLFPIY